MKETFSYPNPYAEKFNTFKHQLEAEQMRLRAEISTADKNQQKILHHIEAHELNSLESALVVKAIKELRIRRREAKVALQQVTNVIRKCGEDIDEKSQQTYDFGESFEDFLINIITG